MSFRLVELSAGWQRGRMAQELSALPESFAAGTTVKYRKRFSDYPARAGWTLKLHLASASVLAKTAAADGDDFVVTIAALFAMMAFGLPSVMAALGRNEDHRCGKIVQTHTGPLSIAAAGVQIAAVPVCAIIGLTAFIAFAR